jgi:hypothetical protein
MMGPDLVMLPITNKSIFDFPPRYASFLDFPPTCDSISLRKPIIVGVKYLGFRNIPRQLVFPNAINL